ncbi:MAG: site-specific DNA-methyltransferase [Planctomycetes bacterium]|nr:site-specific DNA-methyltransferase [Planctomycetota bacterium]MBM4065067.1 site-specific DNA-methyltransferase [Planctomycetota bacterium]
MREIKADIRLGDCVEVLRSFADNTFDLIVTSPPYADSRSKTYGGIKPDDYVAWFLPRSSEFLRVLKPTGTFILNIKEKAANGERHTYVLDLILSLRKQGWLWTEEFIWHKKNCYPGKWPNRFRDAWERCLQFNKSKKFKMLQDAVRVPMGEWAQTRLKSLGKNDVIRFNSQAGSGFGKNIANWLNRDLAYPTNVIHLATETGNKNHSATFPKSLPEWFIKLFTQEDDWVLDPFLGSGTTCEVAQEMGRNSVGIDIMAEYYHMSKSKIKEVDRFLLEESASYGKHNRKRNSHVHRKKH